MIGLSESTYCYKPKVPRQERERRDADLRDKIEMVQAEYSCRGYWTVRVNLLRHYNERINGKRILRVMRKYDLFRQIKRRLSRTTDSGHPYPVYPNLIKGFEVSDINQVWVADITYIRIRTGFVFLAVILDVFSRRVVGWGISSG